MKMDDQSQKDTLSVSGKDLFQMEPARLVSSFNLMEGNDLSSEIVDKKVQELFEWGRKIGAQHYSFLCYPRTEGICQKQQTFVNTKYTFNNGKIEATSEMSLPASLIIKGQGDGSSFPSGNLRQTHNARGYTILDSKSEVFVRMKNKVMYLPALLVSHDGLALDDKTIFRNAEKQLGVASRKLLSQLGIQTPEVVMALGLEQEFFVVPKETLKRRLDIKATGRALFGKVPSKNQQFSDHYYGKIPQKVQNILKEVEEELFEMGVPIKTRHKEVAPNQYQFCPLYEEVGKTIDHNMIAMQIMKQKFQKHGLTVLFHQKPFLNLNGSGKHCNWSLNYVNKNKGLYNLFQLPKDQNQISIFKLFLLMNLMAIQNNPELYMSAIASPGNELRLGGHEAPPRLISVFLGSTLSALLDGHKLPNPKNFKDILPNINYDIFQENTDRNRTSPYAFTGNRFEFRAVGSSQNVSFPMTVIAATLTKEINVVSQRLKNGEKLQAIIKELTQKTRKIRFDGNGYSQQWLKEAKQRGLTITNKFSDLYKNVDSINQVFIDTGICSKQQIEAKFISMQQNYIKIVTTQSDVLQRYINKDIVPQLYSYYEKIRKVNQCSSQLAEHSNKFLKHFKEMIQACKILKNESQSIENVNKACELRQKVINTGIKVEEALELAPRFAACPQLDEILGFL